MTLNQENVLACLKIKALNHTCNWVQHRMLFWSRCCPVPGTWPNRTGIRSLLLQENRGSIQIVALCVCVCVCVCVRARAEVIPAMLQEHYTLITNLMHWLLFIHKIQFSSTCFEHQALIFRRTHRGVFRPRQTRQLPRAVDLKGRFLSCQSY